MSTLREAIEAETRTHTYAVGEATVRGDRAKVNASIQDVVTLERFLDLASRTEGLAELLDAHFLTGLTVVTSMCDLGDDVEEGDELTVRVVEAPTAEEPLAVLEVVAEPDPVEPVSYSAEEVGAVEDDAERLAAKLDLARQEAVEAGESLKEQVRELHRADAVVEAEQVRPGEVREWAQAQGYDVGARGRVKVSIYEAYAAAHAEPESFTADPPVAPEPSAYEDPVTPIDQECMLERCNFHVVAAPAAAIASMERHYKTAHKGDVNTEMWF